MSGSCATKKKEEKIYSYYQAEKQTAETEDNNLNIFLIEKTLTTSYYTQMGRNLMIFNCSLNHFFRRIPQVIGKTIIKKNFTSIVCTIPI